MGLCFLLVYSLAFQWFLWVKIKSIDESTRSLYEEWCWYYLQSGSKRPVKKKQGAHNSTCSVEITSVTRLFSAIYRGAHKSMYNDRRGPILYKYLEEILKSCSIILHNDRLRGRNLFGRRISIPNCQRVLMVNKGSRLRNMTWTFWLGEFTI